MKNRKVTRKYACRYTVGKSCIKRARAGDLHWVQSSVLFCCQDSNISRLSLPWVLSNNCKKIEDGFDPTASLNTWQICCYNSDQALQKELGTGKQLFSAVSSCKNLSSSNLLQQPSRASPSFFCLEGSPSLHITVSLLYFEALLGVCLIILLVLIFFNLLLDS